MPMTEQEKGVAAFRPADWLHFAAAPTFAAMALATLAHEGSGLGAMCAPLGTAPIGGLSMSGMALMYALMSAFHLAPWLNLASRRRRSVGQLNE